ncbi:CDP-alcohol phosphatidyltransferase family protein [Tianweitania sp. Rool2]|uniref:CDP-alcohol phosphatidyltransferase family protein n=2 Tax=Oryzicola mucosus TaxID=2767425 RepID=A0A8J6U4Y8_9HYPH|nr:CDP-alcohol phosphatidyltransferase family protein [Oryzicola mucosus]
MRPRSMLRGTAARTLLVLYLIALSAFLLAGISFPLEFGVGSAAAISLAFIYAVVLKALPGDVQGGFGYANTITALRTAMVCFVGAVVFIADAFGGSDQLAWLLVLVASVAVALDGIDGYLARRFAEETGFGARFDMEIDALLILILSAAALILQKAGWWVLLIGLMRYMFVAAQHFFPKLRRELLPSFRRKLVCVIQMGVLCLILAPWIDQPFSSLLAGFALAALTYSFAMDVRFLMHLPGKKR